VLSADAGLLVSTDVAISETRSHTESYHTDKSSVFISINIRLLRHDKMQANNMKHKKYESHTNNVKEAAVSNKRGRWLICVFCSKGRQNAIDITADAIKVHRTRNKHHTNEERDEH